MKEKIFIDTDVGDDIDDALALSLAFSSEEVEVVGITTVMRDTVKRGKTVKKLAEFYGKNVPVYAGRKRPLDGSEKSETVLIESDAEKYTVDNEEFFNDGESAVDFMIYNAEKFGEELTIVGIGPLTNVAAAIEKSPETMKKVKKIIVMGGAFFNGKLEWNIMSDALAAKIVFESGIPVYAVGTDVTEKLKLNNKRQFEILRRTEGVTGFLSGFAKQWIEKRGADLTLHDPLAVYAAFKPELLHFVKHRVYVVTEKKPLYGYTLDFSLNGYYKNSSYGSEIFVADYVSAEETMADFMKRVFKV